MERFLANQLGVSVWSWVGEGGAGRFEAKTYNFYAMPPEEQDRAADSRFFLSDPGSLHFLASNGFDFNKWIYGGIPFAPLSERRAALAKMAERVNGGGDEDGPTLNDDTQKWRDEKVAAVERWLAGEEGQEAAPLELDRMNGFQRLVLYRELKAIQDRQRALGGEAGSLWWEKADEGRGNWCGLRLEPLSAAEVEARKEAQKVAAIARVHDRVGLSAVLELVRDAGLPVVGHNVSLDLLFVSSQFVGPLPDTWGEYQRRTRHWMPGGVFDTKLLCRSLPYDVFKGQTSLEDIHSAFVDEGAPVYKAVHAYLESLVHGPAPKDSPGGGAEGAEAAAPPAPREVPWELPRIAHASGFDRYVDVGSGGKAHEAGYDAFMTGAAFCALLRIFQARRVAAEGPCGPERAAEAMAAPPSLDAVADFRNRLNPVAIDLAYYSLEAESPVGPRNNVLVVSRGPGEELGAEERDIFDVARKAGQGRLKTEARRLGGAVYLEMLDREMQESADRARGAARAIAEALGKNERTEGLRCQHFAEWYAEARAGAAGAAGEGDGAEGRPLKKARADH